MNDTSPTVDDYRQLIAELVKNDQACPGFGCGITNLGHLLLGIDETLIDLVKAEDPGWESWQANLEKGKRWKRENPGMERP